MKTVMDAARIHKLTGFNLYQNIKEKSNFSPALAKFAKPMAVFKS